MPPKPPSRNSKPIKEVNREIDSRRENSTSFKDMLAESILDDELKDSIPNKGF